MDSELDAERFTALSIDTAAANTLSSSSVSCLVVFCLFAATSINLFSRTQQHLNSSCAVATRHRSSITQPSSSRTCKQFYERKPPKPDKCKNKNKHTKNRGKNNKQTREYEYSELRERQQQATTGNSNRFGGRDRERKRG